MRQINTFAIGAASGSVGRLQREISFPAGQQCTQLDLEAVCPVRNTGGEAVVLKEGQLAQIFAVLFSSFKLEFGRKSPKIVDNSLGFADARAFFQYLTGRDFAVNGVPLATFDTETPAGIPIAPGATVNVMLTFSRAFVFERLGIERNKWCPGATQLRQMRIEVNRGPADFAAATGLTIAQPDAADVTVLAHHVREEAEDQWSPVIRFFKNAEQGLESAGPSEAGVILGVFERTAAGAATPIELFTLGREGDEPIHDNVLAARVVRQGRYDLPLGAIDPNETVTVLYQPPERVRLEELPLGRGFFVRQAAQYVTPMQTGWIFVEEMSRTYGDHIGDNAAFEHGEIKIATLTTDGASPQLAAVLPVSLLRRSVPEFALRAGVVYMRDVPTPTVDLPEAVRAAAVAQVQAQTTTAGKAAAIARLGQTLGKGLPGGTASIRSGVAPRTLELIRSLAGQAHAPELADTAALTLTPR